MLDAYLNVRRNSIARCNSSSDFIGRGRYENNYWKKNKLALKYPSKEMERTTVSWFQLSAISSSVIRFEDRCSIFRSSRTNYQLILPSAPILPLMWCIQNEPEPSQFLRKSTHFHLLRHKIMAPSEPRKHPDTIPNTIAISSFCRVRFYFIGPVSRLRKRPFLNVSTDSSMTKVVSLITRGGVETRKIGINRWTSSTD